MDRYRRSPVVATPDGGAKNAPNVCEGRRLRSRSRGRPAREMRSAIAYDRYPPDRVRKTLRVLPRSFFLFILYSTTLYSDALKVYFYFLDPKVSPLLPSPFAYPANL